MGFSPFSSRLESILGRAFHSKKIEISGISHTLPIALLLTQSQSQEFRNAPHLIITSSQEEAERLHIEFSFFDITAANAYVFLLSGNEVSPYSGLFNSRRVLAQRMNWLARASEARGGSVFICSIHSFLQKGISPENLAKWVIRLQKGDDIPSGFAQKLQEIGYQPTSLVEDEGSFSVRGGIIDIFTPANTHPIRLELFGDTIDSIRTFDPTTQRSEVTLEKIEILPINEVIYSDEGRTRALQMINSRTGSSEDRPIIHSILANQYFQGLEFLLPFFYDKPAFPIAHFQDAVNLWFFNYPEIQKSSDLFLKQLKGEETDTKATNNVLPSVDELYGSLDAFDFSNVARTISVEPIRVESDEGTNAVQYSTRAIRHPGGQNVQSTAEYIENVTRYLKHRRDEGQIVFVCATTMNQCQRIAFILESNALKPVIVEETSSLWGQWVQEQKDSPSLIHIIPRPCEESLFLGDDNLVFLKEDDFFEKRSRRAPRQTNYSETNLKALKFGDLKVGDPVVHTLHGVGIFDGLKIIDVSGVENEFIQIKYKDNDRLYLPVYKVEQIQKFSAPFSPHMLDKLGGIGWQKAKIKVKSHLKEVAAELLNLYAKRSQITRDSYPPVDLDFKEFEALFPYSETDDQIKAIDDILKDLAGPKPMDRLICGDVGFGKTEVAMRAAFKIIQAGKQVAVLVPTTTLCFQHFENFKHRYRKWPIKIGALSRFTSTKDAQAVIKDLKSGNLDIVIGTHKLFSRDIEYKNLGLLVIDEEQRFGVTHKEKLKMLRTAVDTLTLSATPIPRTLNMSLMGIRDLSIINTPPNERLPTRTFLFKHNLEIVKKAILSEIARGGQVLFVHNRVQSIYGVEDELKQLVPTARIRVGHGQMKEDQLEKTILSFFKHEFDVLLCTTIIESGMDIPRANTMIIDRADTFGLSQLYQLRGRVGRGSERAYCYLLIPPHGADAEAQERLKVLQENTALGSGLKIAQYDMELRGTGDILGETQSGHINAVGYDLYIELLDAALREARGLVSDKDIPDPEVNLRIPAFIPDSYIDDIRLRLSYYKILSDARNSQEIDSIESDLRDRFGQVPQEVLNLLGMILIRNLCIELGIREVSAGPKNISMTFSDQTKALPDKIIKLATGRADKYKLLPNNRIVIRLENRDWSAFHGELVYLKNTIF